MNEFNIDEEQPDKDWIGFRNCLCIVVTVVVGGIILTFMHC